MASFMRSKALCKSQNNTPTIILLLRNDNILLINVYIATSVELLHLKPVAYPGIFFWGGVQKIQFRTQDRQNGDLGAVAL